MPLPSHIQGTDTFNTWLDATNNVISHVANTSVYVLVSNATVTQTATGNLHVNGAIHTAAFVANANVVLGGTSITDANSVFRLTTNSSNSNTIAIFGSNLTIAMTNTVLSGTDLSIGQNTAVVGRLTVSGISAFTANVNVASTVLSISSNASVNSVTVGATNIFDVTANSTVSTVSSNSTVYTATAANITFTATNFTISPNTVITGTFRANSTATFNAAVTFANNISVAGRGTFDYGATLGGPVDWKSSSIYAPVANLSGAGVESALTVDANSTIYRVSSDVADKVIAGIQQANTSQYRQLVLFNVGVNSVLFEHANSAAGTAGVWCPGNTNFMIPSQGTALLYYDANTSIRRWRVISAPIGQDVYANTTVPGYVSITTQSFAGAKTFTGAVTASSTLGVTGAVTLSNTLAVTGAATLSNTLAVTGAANALSTLGIGGAVNALSTLGVTGAATLSNTLAVTGAATLSSTLGVTGAVTVNGISTFANTVDLNTSSYGRLVLPVGADKWST